MNYKTNNSGNNRVGESGMAREVKTGKPRYDLIPLDALKRLAELYARGAEIYGDRNWEKGNEEDLKIFKQSAFRHFMQWQNGENDEDHASAIAFNVFGFEHCKRKIEEAKEEKEKEKQEKKNEIRSKFNSLEYIEM